ncbi:Transmembrane protein [Pseudomonas jessenii]
MSICLAITDADWSLTKDVFTIVGTLVSAAGVGLAFYVGLAGLATWRKQLRGTAHHELARKALVELYRFRESVERARSPVMMRAEMDLDPQEDVDLSSRERGYLRHYAGYQRRFEAVFAARAPIEATLLESEALWDKELHELFEPLFKLQHELKNYVEFWFMASDPREDDAYKAAHWDAIKDKPNLRYDNMSEEGDEFRQKFNRCVTAIEQYLKPKLA